MTFAKIYKYLFIIRSKFKKKLQKEFFYIEKHKKFVSLYHKLFLVVQNYCYEITNKVDSSITFNSKISRVILIFYSLNKSLAYKINNQIFKKIIHPSTINFLTFKNISNKKIKILSNKKDIIIKKIHIKKGAPRKLVLCILLDGLNNKILKSLKYTNNYFKNNILENAWSNAEWTMPSYTNLITGNLTSKHKVLNPVSFYKNINEAHMLKDKKTLFNFFSSEGFVTGCYTGCVRINPTYNLTNDIDIFKHCDGDTGEGLIEHVKGQLELFKDTSNFVYLHLLDGHHEMDTGFKMSNFSFLNDKNYNDKLDNKNENYKSPFRRYRGIYKDDKLSLYKDADLILGNLYNYLEKKKFDDYTIMIFGDHGQVMDNEEDQNHLLCNDMCNIGFGIKDKKFKRFKKNKMINMIDIFPSLVERYKKKEFKKEFDGINSLFSNKKREITISESFFNGRMQVALRDNSYDLHASKNTNQIKFEEIDTFKREKNKIIRIKEKKIKNKFIDHIKRYEKKFTNFTFHYN